MPRFPLGMLKPTLNRPDRMRVQSELMKPEYFHSIPLESAGMLLFRHGTPHAGTRNNSKHERVVLFAMASIDPNVDAEQQYFEWHYIRDAFGIDSPEFAASVYRNHRLGHTPAEREDGPMRAHMQALIAQEEQQTAAQLLVDIRREACRQSLLQLTRTPPPTPSPSPPPPPPAQYMMKPNHIAHL
jgi:hypothetical protein